MVQTPKRSRHEAPLAAHYPARAITLQARRARIAPKRTTRTPGK